MFRAIKKLCASARARAKAPLGILISGHRDITMNEQKTQHLLKKACRKDLKNATHTHELKDQSGTEGTETSHTVVIMTVTFFLFFFEVQTKHGECTIKCFDLATGLNFLKSKRWPPC